MRYVPNASYVSDHCHVSVDGSYRHHLAIPFAETLETQAERALFTSVVTQK